MAVPTTQPGRHMPLALVSLGWVGAWLDLRGCLRELFKGAANEDADRATALDDGPAGVVHWAGRLVRGLRGRGDYVSL